MRTQRQLSHTRPVAALAAIAALLFAQAAFPWPMPRIPKEQIPDDMAPEIRKHVEGLYDIRDDNVCLASVKALGEMGPAAAPAAPFLASILDRHKTCPTPNAAADALVQIGKASVEPTILALKVGDAYGRGRAIAVLRQLKDPRAIPALVNAIADGIGGRAAMDAVVEMGGTDYIFDTAKDPTPEIRQVAMRALPVLGTPKAVEALVAALDDSNEKVRQLAIYGLNEMLGRIPPTVVTSTNSILAALKAPDAETRRHTLRLVMRLSLDPKTKGEAVTPMLSDPDPTVVADAIGALGSMKTAESVALLRKAERHVDPLVRASVAGALGDTCQTSAVEAVEAFLADDSGIVRERAVSAIASLKGRDASARLVAMLKSDRDAMVKRRILQVLGNWKAYGAVPDPAVYLSDDDESVRTAILDLAVGEGTNAIPLLIQAMTNGFEKVREHASGLLERNPGFIRDASRLLPELLDSSLADARLNAIRFLARDPSGITNLDAIVKAVDDRNSQVKSSAIYILGQRRDNRRMDATRAAAKSYDEGLALSAVGALAQFGDVAALAEATSHHFDRVRHTALDGLARIGTPESQKALAEIQKKNKRSDMQSVIASTVAESSGKTTSPETLVASFVACRGQCPQNLRSRILAMGTNITSLLSGVLTNSLPALRSSAIDILAEIKDRSAVPALVKAVDDTVPDVRERAIVALAGMREKGGVPAICESLDDESPSVREQAVLALGAIGDTSCLPSLRAATNTPDWRIRGLVMQTLGKLKDPASAAALRDALHDPHWHVRSMAAEALAQVSDRRAAPDLIASLDDPHWNVRRSASASLRAVTGQSLGQDAAAWREWWDKNQGSTATTNAVDKTK